MSKREEEDNYEFELELLTVDASWSLQRLTDYRKYLQDSLLRLQDDSGSIKLQLDAARMEQAQTGQFAERGWWRRANDALRHKKLDLQAVQLALGETNRCLKQKQHIDNEKMQDRAFVKAARRMLSTDLFMQILKASQEDDI
jgi:hypothetical protein